MTQLRIVCLAVVGLAGFACAGAPEKPPQPTGPPMHACELILLPEADPDGLDGLMPAKTEVDQSVGDEFAKCVYATPDLPPHLVSLEVRRFVNEKRAGGAQRTAVDYLPSLAAEPLVAIAGLGDEAVWAGGKLGQLHVRDGRQRLIVTVETGDPVARRARAEAIAGRALERLHAPPPGATRPVQGVPAPPGSR